MAFNQKYIYVHLSTIVHRGEISGKYEPSSNESVVLNPEPFQAFKRFDKDGDGLVTLSELMSLIKKARMKVKTLECSIKASGGREHAWAGGKSSARGGGPGGVFTTNSNWPSAGWLFFKNKIGMWQKSIVLVIPRMETREWITRSSPDSGQWSELQLRFLERSNLNIKRGVSVVKDLRF